MPDSRQGTMIGAGVAIGAGVGAALFGATDSPVWIGVGAAIGAAVGASRSRTWSDDEPDGPVDDDAA
jgi:hypothetical protein